MTLGYRDMKQAIGHDWYATDPNLGLQMDRLVDAADRDWVEGKLAVMGPLIGGRVAENAEITDKNPARLERWDREGDEINRVVHPASALDTKRLLWSHDFLHLPWSAEVAERGRPAPVPLLVAYHYLLCQAETGMFCSVGMTAGVLRLVERYGDAATRELFVPRLKQNDYDAGWDGSMYLTERAGGSDVGATETVAKERGGAWKLSGLKWFCSNVDGDAFVTLARPEGAAPGVRGLALFAVPRVFPDGRPNGVHIRRIKDKLGTRAVPTGEIDLADATGYLLGEPGAGGIQRMMEFVTESRLGVAAMGAGISRRCFLEAAIRASQRRAFGHVIADYGMVREQLLDLLVASEASAAMLFGVAGRLDGLQPGEAVAPLVRILVPLTKIRCTRQGIASASQALELFGGNGYIENFPLARQLRDAQCHTIWEGTENVLALDVLRSMKKQSAHQALVAYLDRVIESSSHAALASTRDILHRARGRLVEALGGLAGADRRTVQLRAGRLANLMADAAQVAALLEEAGWELERRGSARKAIVASWLARGRLEPGGTWHAGREAVALDLFEPVIGYADIEPAEAIARAML